MVVGLLGGTFNPPHIGHLLIAQQVLDFTDCEQIWFLPGYKHTFFKQAVDPETRIKMVKLLLSDSLAASHLFTVSTLEIDHKLDGETIHLLPFLPKEHDYRFIIGSDQLPTFHLWGNWQELLKALPFYVFPRYGYSSEPIQSGMKIIHNESLIVSNISSTNIRERIKKNLPIELFVGKVLSEFIKKNNVYEGNSAEYK